MPPAVCIVEFTRSGRGTLSSIDPPRHLVVRGIGTYTDDLKLPGLLHATILRSPHAHARVLSIDTRSARRIPGVVAVLVGADINDKCGVVPCSASLPGLKAPRHTVLAGDRVYFVGHGVVVAVATDPYLARDAVEAIEVDYDPLPAVVNPEEALRAGALLTHPDLGTNVAYTHTMGGGDIDDAFRRADKIIGQRLIHQRLTPMPIEPRAGVASFHAGEGTLTIWTATQVPHLVRTLLPGMIAIAENKLRIIVPEVGGGFGAKLNVYAEEALCGHLAMRLGAAVKWVESRRENAAATIHGRDQIGNYKMAVKSDGTIAIGAMATHYAIESSSVLWDRCPLLSETAAQIDDVQIRNRGTIGGNLAHADPAGDWPAIISRVSRSMPSSNSPGARVGERFVRAIVFVDLFQTAIGPDEILCEIRVPATPRSVAYEKTEQKASGFALAGVAVVVPRAGDLRIGVTDMTAKAYPADAAERALDGRPAPSPEAIARAAALVGGTVQALGDIHASPEFCIHLAKVNTRRALMRAFQLT